MHGGTGDPFTGVNIGPEKQSVTIVFERKRMRVKQHLHNIAERVAYWSVRRIFTGYARVFATGLSHLDAKHDLFEQQVKAVAENHWQHLNALNARLQKLERINAQAGEGV